MTARKTNASKAKVAAPTTLLQYCDMPPVVKFQSVDLGYDSSSATLDFDEGGFIVEVDLNTYVNKAAALKLSKLFAEIAEVLK